MSGILRSQRRLVALLAGLPIFYSLRQVWLTFSAPMR
jgi:hypothetical protein